jgi:hypothetical protein
LAVAACDPFERLSIEELLIDGRQPKGEGRFPTLSVPLAIPVRVRYQEDVVAHDLAASPPGSGRCPVGSPAGLLCRTNLPSARSHPDVGLEPAPAARGDSAVLALVHDYGEDDDDALDDHLHERRHVHQVKAVVDDAEDQRTDDGAPYRADATVEAGSADDGGGDGVKLDAGAQLRVAGADAAREDDAGETGQQADEGVDADLDAADVDTGDASRLLVATDRLDMPTEPGTPQHHVGEDRTDSEQPDRQREAQDAALTEGVESGCQTGDTGDRRCR